MDNFEQVWTSSDNFGQVRTSLEEFRPWTWCLSHYWDRYDNSLLLLLLVKLFSESTQGQGQGIQILTLIDAGYFGC